MAKLNSFRLTITTGGTGPGAIPRYSINGFLVDFDETQGGVGVGETFVAAASPYSFPHTLLLVGPESGTWEIEKMDAWYDCEGEEPYTVLLGAVTLDAQSDLNLWYERPERVLDV